MQTHVVICAGDFCNTGALEDIIAFNTWFKDLPCTHKIVIAGNHDVSFENNLSIAKTFLDDSIIYLQDELVKINGISFYGSPWQLPFNNWAFNLSEDALRRKFDRIPNNVDILITHSPPYGILDSIPTKKNLGSKSLLEKIQAIKPKFHIFGHIHHGYGEYQDSESGITYMNVSLLDEGYNFVNEVKIIEV